MLKERARKYYMENDYNCAESIIRAANDEYGLGLDETGLRAFGGFGGGMQCGNVCGAVSGGIGAISAKEISANAHGSNTLMPKCKAMMREFQGRFGSEICAKVRRQCFNKETRCLEAVEGAADILEEIMK